MRKAVAVAFRIYLLYLIAVSILQKDIGTLILAILVFMYEMWLIIKEERIEKENFRDK